MIKLIVLLLVAGAAYSLYRKVDAVANESVKPKKAKSSKTAKSAKRKKKK